MASVGVIVPSCGRPHLKYTVESVVTQMDDADQLMVEVRHDVPWGNAMRQEMMKHMHTQMIVFMDDDDIYFPGALHTIRRLTEENLQRVHMFRMRYWENDFVLWQDQEVRIGNVAAQMVAVPNIRPFPSRWGDRREGDFDFIKGACRVLGEPIWHEEIIALVRHPGMTSIPTEEYDALRFANA